jgi:hypothetical protein
MEVTMSKKINTVAEVEKAQAGLVAARDRVAKAKVKADQAAQRGALARRTAVGVTLH